MLKNQENNSEISFMPCKDLGPLDNIAFTEPMLSFIDSHPHSSDLHKRIRETALLIQQTPKEFLLDIQTYNKCSGYLEIKDLVEKKIERIENHHKRRMENICQI